MKSKWKNEDIISILFLGIDILFSQTLLEFLYLQEKSFCISPPSSIVDTILAL